MHTLLSKVIGTGSPLIAVLVLFTANAQTPSPTLNTLYSFTNESNGIYPYGGLAISESGVLYGTLSGGGEHNSGAVFSLNPVSGGTAWKEKVLHKFRAGPGGGEPYTDVVVGPGGALYSTTA